MCIRDRVIADRAQAAAIKATEDLLAKAERILRSEDDGIEAVSYTHLRAHETVLDLVCRLLLEKKKTNKQDHKRSNHTRTQQKQI